MQRPIDIRHWIQNYTDYIDRPWMVVGKGPSFSLLDKRSFPDHVKLGLNHVCREELPFRLDSWCGVTVRLMV